MSVAAPTFADSFLRRADNKRVRAELIVSVLSLEPLQSTLIGVAVKIPKAPQNFDYRLALAR